MNQAARVALAVAVASNDAMVYRKDPIATVAVAKQATGRQSL